MKNILGLDLGTNSIGWALIEHDFESKEGKILGMGSRIIPMSHAILGEFDRGNSVSQTAERTHYRSIRKLRERYLLRRGRLHRVLNVLGFLPKHFANKIDFEKRLGQFKTELEPLLAYDENGFIFQKSFNEMLEDFKMHQPTLVANCKKIPYDWTIYYLRKKALQQKVEKEELAWILLNFNVKRGYYQRTDETNDKEKDFEIISSQILNVIKGEKDKKYEKYWYEVKLENDLTYKAAFYSDIFHWIGQVREFVVKTSTLKDGTVKKEISFLPTFDEIEAMDKKLKDRMYAKIKIKTELEIDKSNKTVGAYIYDTLLLNPDQKIKGKLVRTIDRKFYKDELKAILEKQISFHPALQDENMYSDCVRELYRNNEIHQLTLSGKGFFHLFVNDIIFYQRSLRSQKSSIGECGLEKRKYKDADGQEQMVPPKAIPKSNPLYQEFRLWKWMNDLIIYNRDEDANVTGQFFQSFEDYENLFGELIKRKEIKQEGLLKYLVEQTGLKGRAASTEAGRYRWNFVEDKTYPCNETGMMIFKRLEKVRDLPENFLTKEREKQLWHIIYSVTDKAEYEKALSSFAKRHGIDESTFVENFRKFPPFKREYGSYSEKAIKKLLPLMRSGKYWNWEAIDLNTQIRIEKIITGEYDEGISDRVREKAKLLTEQHHFQTLPDWLAKYVVYGRHSEASDLTKWSSPADIGQYLEKFRQHSLGNPIVEQVVTETLRVVKDIWQHYGNSAKNYFNEIHIELGREMKNTAEDRKRITSQISENENTNLRLKALLAELLQSGEVENVRPYSPAQLEILKVYEDGVLNSNIEIPDDIGKISKTAQPTSSQLQRYKLWLEQKYRSPYTGEMIPLSRLFTIDYEIEHIIPQGRFFDDSFTNKVICEAAVNKLKDNQLGLEFIQNHHGEKVETGFGKTVTVFDVASYQSFVKEHYDKNRSKKVKLLLDEIPEKMIERQMNDTRYISKYISSILSSVVRTENNDEGVNSKNLIPCNGRITSYLKQDWGLNDVWNDLILPRFDRMNELTQNQVFTTYSKNHHKFLPTVPLEFAKGFQKKRIDHRHHALDALVIACTTRDHVNLLNNQHAKSDTKRYDLQRKLRQFERTKYFDKKQNRDIVREVPKDFLKPWANFTADAKAVLETIIVSFKQNLRVINKATNMYERWVEKNGIKTKEFVSQIKGDSWAIRKSMHQATVAGLVKLLKRKEVSLPNAIDEAKNIVDKSLRKKILELMAEGKDKKKIAKFFKDLDSLWEGKQIRKVEIYNWEVDNKGNGLNVASRVKLDNTFGEGKIKSITDTGIQKILMNHLERYKDRSDEKVKAIAPETLAFSPEGIEDMNKNLTELNEGNPHKPIIKVRTYEPKGNKFTVGSSGNKKNKFVEAEKGTNLFFAVYWDEQSQKRKYETIQLNEVIEHQKWRATLPQEEQSRTLMIPVNPDYGRFLFSLSPNDLVYVPEKEGNVFELDFNNLSKSQTNRIYKFTDSSETTANFIPGHVASLIFNMNKSDQQKIGVNLPIQNEFGIGSPQSKNQRSTDGVLIKETCFKIDVDRLGNVISAKENFFRIASIQHDIAFEAEAIYYRSSLKKFDSFEDMENDQLSFYATLTPEDLLKNLKQLSMASFGVKDEGSLHKPDRKIKFD